MKRRALLPWAGLIAQPAQPVQPALAQADTVDADTSTRAELESLPGMGPTLVQRLLAAQPFSD
ncbi:MAG TPA: hypothetical protein VGF12_16295 [Roseateles sp.]|uniref:hypothetical protein n=1 Tax=Roseateles sp. TaxID=1971397 RepID=UPI002EDAB2A5